MNLKPSVVLVKSTAHRVRRGLRYRARVSSREPDSESKADLAYALIKRRIIDRTYVPGYRIVVDQLVRESGLSNIPLREAIRRLEAEGWIEVVRNVGARVALFDVEDHRNTLELIARLEGFATALAQPNLTAADIAAARALDREMGEALDVIDLDRFGQLNRRFHALFHERSGDAHIASLLTSELQRFDVIRRSVSHTVPGRHRASIAEHERLLDLLEAGASSEAIETCARQHKLNGLDVPTPVA
ncbi:GntR family transcriptional regulator [Curtobacterium sp. PhB130]|nr:GntR family transcriptional regulator [Curtobacterium sp. PhB130]TCK59273.1 GntR family transcriptional regulator [Curtobacterium sp. PhB136]